MDVTVVGSYSAAVSKRNGDKSQAAAKRRKFEKACEAIGEALARSGHRLIVAHGEHSDTAEAHALLGFQKVHMYRYYQCIKHDGDATLKAHFDAVEMSEAVILIGGENGTYAAGLSALRRRKVMVPIPVFGGSAKDLCEIPEIDKTVVDAIRNLNFSSRTWTKELTVEIIRTLNAFPKLLIIHGRRDPGSDLVNWIRRESRDPKSKLSGVDTPKIMDLSGLGAVSVPDVFEDFATEVSAAIAIVTADDVGGFARLDGVKELPSNKLVLKARARENVWVEVGWFWGRLGRRRVFLWLKDQVDLPSDLQGAAWTEADVLDKAWPSIEAFLLQMRERDHSRGFAAPPDTPAVPVASARSKAATSPSKRKPAKKAMQSSPAAAAAKKPRRPKKAA